MPASPDDTTRALAIAGLVCGIVGICLGAGALSVAIVALVKANKASREAARKSL